MNAMIDEDYVILGCDHYFGRICRLFFILNLKLNARLALTMEIKQLFEELAFTWLVIQVNTHANIYVFCVTRCVSHYCCHVHFSGSIRNRARRGTV
jgi:hypothetical protein